MDSSKDKKRILVIDDDENLRDFIQDILTIKGFQVETACDGLEGYNKSISFSPHLIITDIIMPDHEGLELITKLRKNCSDLKIIAISGGQERSDVYLHLAGKFGADIILKKPFTNDQLLQSVTGLTTD